MKNYIFLIVLLFYPLITFSQELVSKYEVYDTFEDEAQLLTAKFDSHLGLRAEQRILFQKKIEEYLIRKQEIKDAYDGKEALDKLFVIREFEIEDMSEILTQNQWRIYEEIQSDIQPLAIAVEE